MMRAEGARMHVAAGTHSLGMGHSMAAQRPLAMQWRAGSVASAARVGGVLLVVTAGRQAGCH